jgi:hypothetical protein
MRAFAVIRYAKIYVRVFAMSNKNIGLNVDDVCICEAYACKKRSFMVQNIAGLGWSKTL